MYFYDSETLALVYQFRQLHISVGLPLFPSSSSVFTVKSLACSTYLHTKSTGAVA